MMLTKIIAWMPQSTARRQPGRSGIAAALAGAPMAVTASSISIRLSPMSGMRRC